MKISWQPLDSTGRSGLTAEPEHYDGFPPVSALLTDGAPRQLTGERMAVAAVLVFGRHTSGTLTFPQPIAPATASAVSRFSQGIIQDTAPISYEPFALPIGENCFDLRSDVLQGKQANGWGKPRDIRLDIQRSDEVAGQLSSLDSLTLASNAWLHRSTQDRSDVQYYYPEIAVSLLYAESMLVGTVALPSAVDRTSAEFHRLGDLLESCRFGIASQPSLQESPPASLEAKESPYARL